MRLCRERAAVKEGRTLDAYVPRAEKERRAALVRAEREADRLRKRWAAEWLRPFNVQLDAELDASPESKERHAAEVREYYAEHRQQEVVRHLAWKAANPERINEYDRTRYARLTQTSDGTATPEAIAALKRHASHCAYCGSRLLRKQTDHMEPLALGGAHSMQNIVIVCPDCNARKARLSYENWIDRINPIHRARVVALYVERYGALAA